MTNRDTNIRDAAKSLVFNVRPLGPINESNSCEEDNDLRRSRLIFLSTALGAFLVTANVSTMNVAFPDLERTFTSTDRGTLTWVLNAYTISFAALLIPAGRLADRFGRRHMFTAGLSLFAVSSLLVGAAPTFPILVAARVAQGVGGVCSLQHRWVFCSQELLPQREWL